MMEHTHHFRGYQRNPLDIKELAEFDATIAGLTQTEQRRRRLIYLRDAARQVRMGKSFLKGFGWLLVPFAIIPIFWPFFIFFWFIRKKAGSMMEYQLKNALEYWGIHEVEIDEYVNEDSFDSDNLIPGL
ncbi:MAG: hypothetical protein JW715_12920 [Sedimentisphaerales bacterium]|nr:hypothetical protein [Sedimentisphaerales bacterium]